MNGKTWWSLLLGIAAFACGDDSGGSGGETASDDASAGDAFDSGSDASSPRRECDQVANGTPCGRPNSGMHCIYNACLKNICGDGVKSGDEECDDGDEIDFDGCSARCKMDTPGCGNGVKDPTEDCDDGNRVDTDTCTAQCKMAKCGDGIVGPGEQCDDANSNDGDSCTMACRSTGDAGVVDAGRDAGSAANDAGARDAAADAAVADAAVVDAAVVDAAADAAADASGSGPDSSAPDATVTADAAVDAAADASVPDAAADAGPGIDAAPGSDSSVPDATVDSGVDAAPAVDSAVDATPGGGSTCAACRREKHRDYLGSDIYAGCFEAINTDFGAMTPDPAFLQDCMNVVSCADRSRCAYDPVKSAAGCFCGSANIDDCNLAGPAPDAACVPEFQAAARSTELALVTTRMTDLAYPLGWAYFVLNADRGADAQPTCPACVNGAP